MSKRVPGMHRTREALRELMEGRRSESFGRTELVQLATRLIIEEGLEAEGEHPTRAAWLSRARVTAGGL